MWNTINAFYIRFLQTTKKLYLEKEKKKQKKKNGRRQ